MIIPVAAFHVALFTFNKLTPAFGFPLSFFEKRGGLRGRVFGFNINFKSTALGGGYV